MDFQSKLVWCLPWQAVAALFLAGSVNVCPCRAADKEVTVQELSRTYKEQLRRIEKEHKQGLSGANDRYLAALEQLAKQMQDQGTASANAIAMVRAEHDRFRATPTLAEVVVTRRPRSLGLRQRAHLDSCAEIRRERSRRIVDLADAYLVRLEQLLRQHERDGAASEVAIVRAEMEKFKKSATVANARKVISSDEPDRDGVKLPPKLATSLVLHFSFDSPSATRIPDESNHDHVGIPNAMRRVSKGRVGGACVFDGSKSSIQVAASKALDTAQGFTVAFWVRPASRVRKPAALLERNAAKGYSIGLSAFDPIISYRWSDAAARDPRSVASSDPIPFADWSHIVVAHGRAGVSLYVNGKLGAQVSGETPLPAVGGEQIALGAKLSSYRPRDHFAGSLDEIMFFSRPVTGEEALALYTSVGGVVVE